MTYGYEVAIGVNSTARLLMLQSRTTNLLDLLLLTAAPHHICCLLADTPDSQDISQ